MSTHFEVRKQIEDKAKMQGSTSEATTRRIRMGRCQKCGWAYLWDTKRHDTKRAKVYLGGVGVHSPKGPTPWIYRATGKPFPCPACTGPLTATQATHKGGTVEWFAYPDVDAVEAPPTPEPVTKKPTPTRKPKTGKSFSDRLDANVASTAPMITEIERLVRLSLHDLAKTGDLGEDWDLDKFKILVTMEPHNSKAPTKRDIDVLGHFTVSDVWKDNDGVTYRAININPYLLRHFDGAELMRTCYHEAIHAWNEYRGVSDCASNGKHNLKFVASVEESGMLVAEKVASYHGYTTPTFTEAGLKLVKKFKPLAPTHSRILPPSKAKKVGPKRVTLQCPECEMKAGVPVGVFAKNLERVLENSNAFDEVSEIDMPEQLYPVMTCSADGSGMMPPENWKLETAITG